MNGFGNINIRALKSSDIPDVVKIHKVAFPGFFLTTLGSSFLNVYYKSVVHANDSIFVGAFIHEKLAGFGAGAAKARGYNKNLILHNLIPFIFEGFKLLLYSPKALMQLKKNFSKAGNDKDDRMYAELYSIAVDPSVSNKGIGADIIHSFEQEAVFRGAEKVSLTTDLDHNEKVLAFYKKNGYNVYYDFIAYPNRRMLRLIKNLTP